MVETKASPHMPYRLTPSYSTFESLRGLAFKGLTLVLLIGLTATFSHKIALAELLDGTDGFVSLEHDGDDDPSVDQAGMAGFAQSPSHQAHNRSPGGLASKVWYPHTRSSDLLKTGPPIIVQS